MHHPEQRRRLYRQCRRHELLSFLSRRTQQFKQFSLAITTNGYFVVRVERGTFNSSPAFSSPAFSVPPVV